MDDSFVREDECAICLEALEAPAATAAVDREGGIRVAPLWRPFDCSHVFHEGCSKRAIAYRLKGGGGRSSGCFICGSAPSRETEAYIAVISNVSRGACPRFCLAAVAAAALIAAAVTLILAVAAIR